MDSKSPSCCNCAQSRNAFIILMVEFDTMTPGYVLCKRRMMKYQSRATVTPYRSMNRVSVKSDGLPVPIIVGSKGILQVLQSRRVVDRACTIGSITCGKCQRMKVGKYTILTAKDP